MNCRLDRMKNSGIEWIGEIPEEWNLIKIGSIFQCRNEKVNDTDYPPLSVSKGGVVPQMESVAKTDANDNRKLVLKNDFVINSRSDRKQSCGLSLLEGSVSLINTVIYVIDKKIILPQYTDYLLKNYGFAEEFYRWGHGIVADLWTTRWQEMKNIALPLSSVEEQQRIADYLDKKCAAVDRLMENQWLQIEKLKEYKQSVITEAVTKGIDKTVPLKSSGVEWIGDIPSKWFIGKKLAYYVADSISYGIVKLLEPDDKNGVKVLRCSDVLEGYIEKQNIRTVTQKVSKEYTRTILKAGDIVVNVRGSLGGCAVVPIEMEGFNIAREVALIRLTSKLYNRFVMYYLLSNSFVNYRTRFLAGSVYIGLNIELLSSMPIVIPPLSEQQQIAEYLDKKCAEIDELISIKQQKIEKLTEYKKSLIYEYVTGKKQVG